MTNVTVFFCFKKLDPENEAGETVRAWYMTLNGTANIEQ